MNRREALVAKWSPKIADYRASGMNLTEWCGKNDVSIHTMRKWIIRLKYSGEAVPTGQNTIPWLPVKVSTSKAVDNPLVVRIGKASVDVQPGFDPKLLTEVVRALTTIC